MYIDPYAKHDEELVEKLGKCMDEIHPECQKDYLINILTYPKYKFKTIAEVLDTEAKAKAKFENDLGTTKKVS